MPGIEMRTLKGGASETSRTSTLILFLIRSVKALASVAVGKVKSRAVQISYKG